MLEHVPNVCSFIGTLEGGFFLRAKPLEIMVSVYGNSENAVVLDPRIPLALPFVLAVLFLLWTLWNLIQEGKRKSPAPSRSISLSRLAGSAQLAGSTQTPAPAPAQIFAFPESSSAARATTHLSQSR